MRGAAKVGMRRFRLSVLALVLAAGVLPGTSSAEGALEIHVLSNRADLVSGGDALVEVVVPDGVNASSITLDVDGRDVTSDFAVRPNGRFMGLVTELAEGENVLSATLPGGSGARITITNHDIRGPVFSGPQIQPWLCTTANAGLGQPTDDQCHADTRIDFFYRPEGGAGFAAYDPDDPPSDVATTATDHGETVPYIIRQETGTQNRGIYRVAVLYNPDEDWEPWDPQGGWNRKLYYPFGASCGTVYSQGSAQNVQNDNALRRGFMVATSSLNVLGNNCNSVLSAETATMLKEHIVDNYGEIRYTFGTGSSGGAIGQHMVANSYPGLLQGLTVGAAFADTITTGAEVFDCHVLVNYFLRAPHLWANPAQQTAVTGHGTSPGTCAGWEALFSAVLDPTTGCGLPSEQVYHPENNPTGARCTYHDFERNVWGKRPEHLWIPPEQIAGGFAKGTFDNIGIQYGLQALQQGLITTEQFVDLNVNVGGFDIDRILTPERTVGDPDTPNIAYRSGRINDGSQLDQVAIIDSRGTGNIDPLLIHTMHHSFALKERMEKAHGHADNHAVWRGGSPASAFDVMDRWLTDVEADESDASLPEKIVSNKPGEATDMCFLGSMRLDDGMCDIAWPYYGAPRIVAGAPTTHDVIKCQLKPLNREDDYGPIPFTDLQWERLESVFGETGVCDYSVPGQQVEPSQPWLSYRDGPGGTPLGPPPTSEAL